jgi:hypothetical protein
MFFINALPPRQKHPVREDTIPLKKGAFQSLQRLPQGECKRKKDSLF